MYFSVPRPVCSGVLYKTYPGAGVLVPPPSLARWKMQYWSSCMKTWAYLAFKWWGSYVPAIGQETICTQEVTNYPCSYRPVGAEHAPGEHALAGHALALHNVQCCIKAPTPLSSVSTKVVLTQITVTPSQPDQCSRPLTHLSQIIILKCLNARC